MSLNASTFCEYSDLIYNPESNTHADQGNSDFTGTETFEELAPK